MNRNLLQKISILSVSLIVGASAATSSITPLLLDRFGKDWQFIIEMIPTLPSLFIICAIFTAPKISSVLGIKKTMIAGLVLALAAGVAPVLFSGSLILLVLFKSLFGFGYGLFNANVFNVINFLYSGKERVQLIGFNSAFQGAGGSSLTLLAGILLGFGWNYSFLVYLLIVPVLFMFIFFVPEIEMDGDKQQEASEISYKVILYILLMFTSMICWNTAVVKLSLHVVSSGIGNASDSSLAFTLQQVAYMATGLVFSRIFGWLKRSLLPLSLAFMSIAAISIALSHSMISAVAGCIAAGISSGLLISYLYTNLPNHASGKVLTLATSGMVVSGHLAAFVSPVVLNWFGKPSILDSTHAQAFLTSAFVLLLLAVITFFVQKIRSRHVLAF